MNDMYPMIGGRRLICNSKIDPLRDLCAVILDTNVIKDIGAFYFGSRLINQDLKKILRYIRIQCRYTLSIIGTLGLCYQLGLSELSLKRDGDINYSIFRNYGSAICKLITCDNDEFGRICSSVPNNNLPYDSIPDPDIDVLIAYETEHLSIFYDSVLHLLSLQIEKNDNSEAIDLFDCQYKWERDELGFVAAFPTLLALYQLLGKDGNSRETKYRGNARHLTKFDPNKINATSDLAKLAWNSAWDMHFLMRLSDYRTGEVLRRNDRSPFSIPAVLVSRDYDPAWLSFSTNPIGEIITSDDSTSLPLFESTSDFFDPYNKMNSEERLLIWKQIKAVKASCNKREEDLAKRINGSISAIHELEDQLNIEHSYFPSWNYL